MSCLLFIEPYSYITNHGLSSSFHTQHFLDQIELLARTFYGY